MWKTTWTSGSSKSSEAYFAFSASGKERGVSAFRAGRTNEAAVGCLLRPGHDQFVFGVALGGCTSFTFKVVDTTVFTGMFSAGRVVPFYT
jgi:hypothetical protein